MAQWFWRRRYFNFVNVFSLFRSYLPLEKGGALHLNKLESPSPKNALCQVWLKLAQWFWRRRFFNFVNVFSLFWNYLPLEKGRALHLINLNPLHSRILCAKFGWNWLSGFWEVENRTSLQTDSRKDRLTDRQTTDDKWSKKLTWAFSSGWAKNPWLMYWTKDWRRIIRIKKKYHNDEKNG